MYGAVEFYDACLQANVKPIIGLTLQIPGIIMDEKDYPIVLIAKDQVGYANLMQISTIRLTTSELTLANLKQYLTHLFIILPPLAEVNDLLLQGRQAEINQLLTHIRQLGVASDSLKIGVDYHSSAPLIDMLSKLAADNQIALIADSPVDYIDGSDYFPMQVLKAIGAGDKINNVGTLSKQVGPYWLRPAAQMDEAYQKAHLQATVEQIDSLVKKNAT